MLVAINIVIMLIVLLHFYFMVLEMFLWDKPLGLKTFGQTKEVATQTKVLAANQGLYNGFLAAGLLWGLSLGASGLPIKVFFLSCILIAGVFGAMSTGRQKIFYIQSLPAIIALILLFLSH